AAECASEEHREAFAACQRAAQRMRRLIESLLELSRFDAGQETMRRERFDLAAASRECVELVQPLAANRDIEIHIYLATVGIGGDVERIGQVILNLLTNAIQYGVEHGTVDIGTRVQRGMAVLAVFNTGLGIPAEDLPHVFDRFYRVDKSRSE